jgi:aryl-alcohol dehydrogenase-like predicted oxidoreductase
MGWRLLDPQLPHIQSLATIDRALELGINLLDTAHIYMHPSGATNEELVGKAIKVLFIPMA